MESRSVDIYKGLSTYPVTVTFLLFSNSESTVISSPIFISSLKSLSITTSALFSGIRPFINLGIFIFSSSL